MAEGGSSGIMQSNFGVLFLLSLVIGLVAFTIGAHIRDHDTALLKIQVPSTDSLSKFGSTPIVSSNNKNLTLVEAAVWMTFACFMCSIVIFAVLMFMSSDMSGTPGKIVAIYHIVAAIVLLIAAICIFVSEVPAENEKLIFGLLDITNCIVYAAAAFVAFQE